MPLHIQVDHVGAPAPFKRELEASDGEGPLFAVGVREGHLEDDAEGADAALLAAVGFEAKAGSTAWGKTPDGIRLFVGLGDGGSDAARDAGAAVVRAAGAFEWVVVDAMNGVADADRAERAWCLGFGLSIGSYGFDRYKARPTSIVLKRASVISAGGRRVESSVVDGAKMAGAVAYARDLVNTPGGDLTPTAFAEQASEELAAVGVSCEVLDRAAIEAERLGGLLGVNRGSALEPRLLKLGWSPPNARQHVVLVGKGITFDAGGLSIKTAAGMEAMKTDMAGGAAVLAAMSVLPNFTSKVRVTAFIPLTDNMLGGDAMRVGDVLTIRNGKTVEVLNTDAEGRLVLADALSLAVEEEPDAIVDLATLTGACMVALGDRTAGLLSNHDGLAQRVQDAADESAEDVWRLPMPEHLRQSLDSEVADLRNIGVGSYGGALTAAIFLREFVGDVPWAHLDIAGPSNSSAQRGVFTKGGTGFGVQTLVKLIAGWSKLQD